MATGRVTVMRLMNYLLALDTNGSGAVITPWLRFSLQISSPSTTSYNTSGGLISNPNGGVVLERLWNVAPTTQPTSGMLAYVTSIHTVSMNDIVTCYGWFNGAYNHFFSVSTAVL